MDWKVGDWCIYDLNIVQIKRMNDEGFGEVSDGMFSTSGKLRDRLRELTLRNKNIIERFDFYYRELNLIDGSQGFNWPRISDYFHQLSRDAIDDKDQEQPCTNKAILFGSEAKEYKKEIQGVQLFRSV